MFDPVMLLPHRPPFLFVDEVVRLDPQERVIEAARVVPWDEPWTAAHLPGRPLVPGVLLVEGMAQTCGILARRILGGEAAEPVTGVLASVRSARFRQTVEPGARLVYRGRLKARAGSLCLFSATAEVEGRVVADVEMIGLALPPRS